LREMQGVCATSISQKKISRNTFWRKSELTGVRGDAIRRQVPHWTERIGQLFLLHDQGAVVFASDTREWILRIEGTRNKRKAAPPGPQRKEGNVSARILRCPGEALWLWPPLLRRQAGE